MSDSVKLQALIVESDSLSRAQTIERLKKHSIVCIEADNGMEALQQLENHQIDFVISEAHMKKMDGIQFIEIIQRNHKDIPVVVTIEPGDEETAIKAFRAGAVNVVNSSSNSDEIESIVLPITNLIDKRKSRKFDFKNVRYFTEELRLINDPALIPVTVDHLIGFLKDSRFANRLTGLEVALYEILANAIEHGNLAITRAEKELALSENRYYQLLEERQNLPGLKNRSVKIKLNYNSRQLNFTIIDEGEGFDIETLQSAEQGDLLAESGRGILLSRMYCDEILYNNRGNEVTLILKSGSESEQAGIIHTQTKKLPEANILIVDNNPQILGHISNLLSEIGYSYGYIAQPEHLFPRLEEESFDLILLDVNLPKIDGLTLLKELQDHSLYRRIPVIMLTSDKNDRLMAECFENGAEDFIVKPVNRVTLQSRINSTLIQRESFKQLGEANEKLLSLNTQLQEQYDVLTDTQKELSARHSQMQEDIRLAQRIQRKILSTEHDSSFLKTTVIFRPHSIVSGDFHYQETDKSGNLNLFLGDATGHGVSAAFITMMVRMALGMTASDLMPDKIIKSLNKQLAECVPRGDHMTGIMLKISPEGELSGCNAGSPPIILLSDTNPGRILFDKGGQALGMFSEERIPYGLYHHQLVPGDRIILFTDGIYEWRNRDNQSFGLESVKDFILNQRNISLPQILQDLTKRVEDFAGNEPQNDDLTLIGFEYK